MKPAYVTVEFWRENRDDTAMIEGWLTVDFIQTNNVLITPSLDYDEATIKIAIAWDKLISITPAQSIRDYWVAGTWKDAAKEHWSEERIRAMVTSGGDETSS